jgi:hypothetical protein
MACTEPSSRPAASTTDFIAIFCQLVLNNNTQSDAIDKVGHDVRFKGPSYSDAGTASFTSPCANNQRQEGTSLKRQEPSKEPRKAFWDLSNFRLSRARRPFVLKVLLMIIMLRSSTCRLWPEIVMERLPLEEMRWLARDRQPCRFDAMEQYNACGV